MQRILSSSRNGFKRWHEMTSYVNLFQARRRGFQATLWTRWPWFFIGKNFQIDAEKPRSWPGSKQEARTPSTPGLHPVWKGYISTNWRQFLCVCPVIDHEFRHNIFKLSVDSGSADYFDNFMTKFIVNVFYYNKLSNCPLSLADASHEFQIHVSVRILTKLANELAWILQLS